MNNFKTLSQYNDYMYNYYYDELNSYHDALNDSWNHRNKPTASDYPIVDRNGWLPPHLRLA